MEQEAKQSYEELSATIDRMAEVVKRINELSAFGIIGITNKGVHLTREVFKKRFGVGRDVTRELKGTMSQDIRCSIMYNGAEFFTWFDVPKDIIVVEFEKEETGRRVSLYELELK